MSGGEVVVLGVIGVGALGGRRLPDARRVLGRMLVRLQRAVNEARHEIGLPEEPPRRSPSQRLID